MAEAPRLAAFWMAVAGWGRWQRLALGIGLGALAGLGQGEGRARVVLVIAALVLALRAVQHVGPRRAAWFGWALGVGYFGVALRWIVEPFFVEPWRHGYLAPFAILGMAGGLALFWALAFGVSTRLARAPGPRVVLLACGLGAAEVLRSHVLSGFPWALLSHAMIGNPVDALFALVGPHGATLVLTLVAAGIAYGLHRGWTLIWPGLVAVYLGLAGLSSLLPGVQPADPQAARVRLVQPNAPQHLKWDMEWIPVFFQRSLDLTEGGDPADLVIWPETSIASLLRNAGPWLEQIGAAGRGAPVVAGVQRWNPEMGYHNSLVVVETDGTLSDIYDKRHLVPFGEYVPLSWMLGRLGLQGLAAQASGFAPGDTPGTIDLPGLGRTRVLICYEGIFPEEIIEPGPRPAALVIITNDAWFGTGPGPRQHLIQARARAIELGLPVLRAANTGISALIDPRGRVLASLPLGEAGVLDVQVPPPAPPPPYARTGDGPALLALLVLALLAVAAARRFDIDPGAEPR